MNYLLFYDHFLVDVWLQFETLQHTFDKENRSVFFNFLNIVPNWSLAYQYSDLSNIYIYRYTLDGWRNANPKASEFRKLC